VKAQTELTDHLQLKDSRIDGTFRKVTLEHRIISADGSGSCDELTGKIDTRQSIEKEKGFPVWQDSFYVAPPDLELESDIFRADEQSFPVFP